MAADDPCPMGGLHIWRYDARLTGEAFMYCRKCGEEVHTEDDK